MSVDVDSDPMSVLPLAAKMRSDAQLRMRGLLDVLERETKEVDYWSTRGRLPDGEQPPNIEEVEVPYVHNRFH